MRTGGDVLFPPGRRRLGRWSVSNGVEPMNAGRRCFLAGVLSVCVPALAGAQPATIRVSVASGGVQGNYGGWVSAMSADGRFIAFEGGGSNLVPGDTNF